MLKLGNITLNAPFFQAPLSGYSDYAMRRLALDFGCPLTFAGVMLAKSAANPKILRKPLFRPCDDEHPIGAQILGSDARIMAKAAVELVKVGYDLIDLNFACPAPKVLRRGRGGALLKKPESVIEILRRVREAVDCPVLMKLRIGFDSSEICRDKFWKIIETACSNGVDALVVHGRTVVKNFRGSADWQILAELKRRFPHKVIIGSGDLFKAEETVSLLKNSGVDGVAIARGAIGNPWIFSRLRAVFEGEAEPLPPSIEKQGEVILKHFRLTAELYPCEKAVRYFRKFVAGYCKLHPERKKVQASLLKAERQDELPAVIKHWYGIS